MVKINYPEVVNDMANKIIAQVFSMIQAKSYSDKTFTAKVTEVISADKVRVQYCGSLYTASTTIPCSPEHIVRVCAPCNNWRELFIIENRTSGRTFEYLKSSDLFGDGGVNPPDRGTANQGAVPPIALAAIGCGKKLVTDPEFSSGSASVQVYSNAAYRPSMERISMPNGGNTSNWVLKFTHTQPAQPGLGGFVTYFDSKNDGLFIQVFRANLPSGFKFVDAQNAIGSGGTVSWYTSQRGTGKWEWYVRATYCGQDGPFSTGGHVYIAGPAPSEERPLIWHLSGVQVYHVSFI